MSSDLPFIALSAPHLSGQEWDYIKECLDTGWVSSVGSYVTRFEKKLAAFTGTKHAVATSSGTAALHLALLVAGVRPEEEVLLPSMTFIAPANAVRYTGAIPVFVDCDPFDWQIDIKSVKKFLDSCTRKNGECHNSQTGRKVSAIIPVHILGSPADMHPLMALAEEYGLTVIEDATESLGSTYHSLSTGGLAHMGCFSFNGNKIITTGGGGMLVTNREEWAQKARYLSTQAKDDAQEYIHHEVGYNYRLTNIQAAFGCAQMEALPRFVSRRREIYREYEKKLSGLPGITFPIRRLGVESNCWLSTIRINPSGFGMDSRKLRRILADAQIETRPLWQPLHLSKAHAGAVCLPCPVAENLFADALSLPSSSFLEAPAIERVIEAVVGAVQR